MQTVAIFFVGVAVIVGFSFIMALPLMWLWNWIMPELFHLPQVSFIQSWGLLVLSSFLFKNATSIDSK